MSIAALPSASTLGKRDLHVWPRYEAAVLGFRDYWYPVAWSREIGRKPFAVQMLGERLMLRRENGTLYAFYDQCPHRGIPLSVGRQEFPGTWTCRYHGWTFDTDGVLRAALTDGPDSPICGKVRVRTYPIEERAGLVFAWMGAGPPAVPVEDDMPDELLKPDSVIVGRIRVRKGNWRYATENSYDEAHAKYLHRYGALMTMFGRMPGWAITPNGGGMDGPWMSRPPGQSAFSGDFPGLGHWPRFRPWQRRRGGARVSVRMPATVRVKYAKYTHFSWFVPVDADQHRYFQVLVIQGNPLQRLRFWLQYWLYRRWIFHVQFNNQDGWMMSLMPESIPERLFRPDASITAWRRMCEHARGDAMVDA